METPAAQRRIKRKLLLQVRQKDRHIHLPTNTIQRVSKHHRARLYSRSNTMDKHLPLRIHARKRMLLMHRKHASNIPHPTNIVHKTTQRLQRQRRIRKKIKNTMIRKIPLTYILIGIIVALLGSLSVSVHLYNKMKADRDRLEENQNILLHNGKVEITQTATGNSHLSAPAVTLTATEFKKSGDTLAKVAKQVGIKASRISLASSAGTTMSANIVAPIIKQPIVALPTLHDTITQYIPDTLKCFSWRDPWLSLSGCVSDSLFQGTITATDTLDIMVHRVPKRFLFFRYGCKQVKMDIISRNPHTQLTYGKFYQFAK
mgnify:FL=1